MHERPAVNFQLVACGGRYSRPNLMGSQNWYGIGIRLQSVNTAVLFWNWSKLEFRFPSTMEIWIDTRGTIVHIIFSRSTDHGSRELGWRRAAMLHLEERSLMEAMSKQVVPVLYEELYQINFLPVLYGPSTGRIVPPTGQSLWRHAPDQHQDSFFSPKTITFWDKDTL